MDKIEDKTEDIRDEVVARVGALNSISGQRSG
jgi:hypothetical protein